MLMTHCLLCVFLCVLCIGQAQSSVYTIDVHNATPVNFTNPGYVSTEGTVKSATNDGLPTYEEAIGGVKPSAPPAPSSTPSTAPPSTIDVVTEDSNGSSSRGRRHRHRRHHRHHHHTDGQNENSEPSVPEEEQRRHHGRRGLRKHLAKMNRRNKPETE